jgi:toxin ParE1/3/4
MRLTWSRRAIEDRLAMFDYLQVLNPGAAVTLDDRLAGAAQALREHPEIGRAGRVDGTRELVVSGTSYILIYAVLDDRIRILRVLHARQRWPR